MWVLGGYLLSRSHTGGQTGVPDSDLAETTEDHHGCCVNGANSPKTPKTTPRNEKKRREVRKERTTHVRRTSETKRGGNQQRRGE